ncbi:hypothetical protein E4T42_09212 [Aureobasidium subglaciale]|nr:hypothetical protein E4T42_09212 [Aureobasidium subglaciale]
MDQKKEWNSWCHTSLALYRYQFAALLSKLPVKYGPKQSAHELSSRVFVYKFLPQYKRRVTELAKEPLKISYYISIANVSANPDADQVQVQEIDLSNPQYTSEGIGYHLQDSTDIRQPDAMYLHLLSRMDILCNFVGSLPRGYSYFGRPHAPLGSSIRRYDLFIWGHPSGRCFRSHCQFFPHVVSIVQNKLDNCACYLCATNGPLSGAFAPPPSAPPEAPTAT